MSSFEWSHIVNNVSNRLVKWSVMTSTMRVVMMVVSIEAMSMSAHIHWQLVRVVNTMLSPDCFVSVSVSVWVVISIMVWEWLMSFNCNLAMMSISSMVGMSVSHWCVVHRRVVNDFVNNFVMRWDMMHC